MESSFSSPNRRKICFFPQVLVLLGLVNGGNKSPMSFPGGVMVTPLETRRKSKSFVTRASSLIAVCDLDVDDFRHTLDKQLGPKAEDISKPVNPFVFLDLLIFGALAATYYVLVPIYMGIKDQIIPKGQPI